MIAFVTRRLLQMAVVLAVLSALVVGLLWLMPGDPVDLLISSQPGITADDVARLRELYGLDDPFLVRYGKMMRQVVWERDLGWSRMHQGVRVSTLLRSKVWFTLQLTLVAFGLAVLLAIPLGIYAAVRQYSALDYLLNFIAFVGISVPSFWLGIMAIYVFAVKLQWFPASGVGEGGLQDRLRHLVLPGAVLSFQLLGSLLRYSRSSMLEVLHMDYMRTARAKGLPEDLVVYKHGLRNALIPVITVLALSMPFLFSGALITETIFAWPGMGRLIYDSIMGRDFHVALVAFLALACLTMVFNLLADVLYAVVDPRIRYA